MITYDPFWKMLKERRISTYALIYTYGFIPDTVQRLRAGKPITTTTLNRICGELHCDITDVIEYRPDAYEEDTSE